MVCKKRKCLNTKIVKDKIIVIKHSYMYISTDYKHLLHILINCFILIEFQRKQLVRELLYAYRSIIAIFTSFTDCCLLDNDYDTTVTLTVIFVHFFLTFTFRT